MLRSPSLQAVRFVSSKALGGSRQATPTRFPTVHNPKSSASNAKIILPKGLVYNPAPSVPDPYETPAAFLPKEDTRQVIKDKQSYPVEQMPALKEVEEKKYHLTEADLIEIHRLRTSEPTKWTRKALAEKFQCSEFVIGVASKPSPEYKAEMDRRLATIQSGWTKRTSRARVDRQRRRDLWVQDA